MASCTEAGAVGGVLSLTRGEAGQIRDASLGTRAELGAVRESELAASARELGIDHVWCCDYADGTLAETADEAMIERVSSRIADFDADAVITFGPDGGYGHPDHISVSSITRAAVERAAVSPVLLEAVFPQQPRLLIELIVDWLTSLDERFLGTPDFAHGLMLFADGSSMLGYAADHLDVRFFPAGTLILEQGEPPGELFLVLSGEVDIVGHDDDGSSHHLARSGSGSFIGEDGIARGQPRNADVVAASSVTCFVLSPGRLSTAAGRGAASSVTRFESNAEQGTVDLVETDDDVIAVDVEAFARRKIRALACHRSQYAIDAELFPDAIVGGIFGTEYFRQVQSISEG